MEGYIKLDKVPEKCWDCDLCTKTKGVPGVSDTWFCQKAGRVIRTPEDDKRPDFCPIETDTRRVYPLRGCSVEVECINDVDFPGIDIEFIPIDGKCRGTIARVLIEWPITDARPRVLVWADADDEDYSHCIPLKNWDGKEE